MAVKKAVKKVTKTNSKIKKVIKPAKEKSAAALIKKDMLIGEVVEKYPETIEVMFRHGMHCIGCGMTAYESIEQGCMGHGMSEEETNKMVDDMNNSLKKKSG
jgi:hybrid cluster-associated redox disulfide protein